MASHKAEMDKAILSLKEDLEPTLAKNMATAMEKVATSTELCCKEALGGLLAQTGPVNDELRLRVESGMHSVVQVVESLKVSVDDIKAHHQLKQGNDTMSTLCQDANVVQVLGAVERPLVHETFDSECHGSGISLSSSGTVATCKGCTYGWRTVCGQTGVSQGKWEWKIEILDAEDDGWSELEMILGIASDCSRG